MTGEPNYTIAGGIKLFFEEGTTGLKGYRDLGNLTATSIQSAIEKLEHFTSRSGQRQKDHESVQTSSIQVNFTFDDPNEFNLRWAFLGGTMTPVTAGEVRVNRELLQLNGTTAATTALDMSVSPNVQVQAIDGSPTSYTVTTDYTIDATANTITRVGGGAIDDGEFVMVSYDAQIPAHNSFPVLESPILEGKARLLIQPTTGQQIWWEIPKATIAPDGEFSLDDQDWMQTPMILSCLADTENNPSAPFGTLRAWSVTD